MSVAITNMTNHNSSTCSIVWGISDKIQNMVDKMMENTRMMNPFLMLLQVPITIITNQNNNSDSKI